MKQINPKAQRRQSLPPAAGGKSNSFCLHIIRSKAAASVCLFLFLYSPLRGQDLSFDKNLLEAYACALNLEPSAALKKLSDQSGVTEMYIASLTEAIELLVTEDHSKFSEYEERFLNRLDRKLKSSAADHQFLQAEMRLQWAFVYLKFGHELDAALYLRQAYQMAQACTSQYPDYLPIRKTSGLLQIIVGSVPEKYNWVLSLLNMSGSVSGGLAQLKEIAQSESPLAFEGKLLHALVQGFILARPDEGMEEMHEILKLYKSNRLALFLSASLALKNSSNEVALERLKDLSTLNQGTPIYYTKYLLGEAYLHKGDYVNAIAAYRAFIEHQPGHNYIKDAHYKIGLCYLLDGKENEARGMFQEARTKGKEVTEADKSAGRSLAEKALPNAKLLKIRYVTDGGYYQEADDLLTSITSSELVDSKDQAELVYRKARLSHKTGRADAEELYLQTVRLSGEESWYFAPNACLQLGYIYRSQNKIKEAEKYFLKALTYRRHEYKNSIDSKARSALAQLGRM